MRITDEMLYAAAPEAAERYLSTLPGREDCAHAFSPDFEERMRLLLPRRKRKKLLRRALLLAAVVALLGTAVYAGQPEDYRVYAAAREGVLTYLVRPRADPIPQSFHPLTPGWLPEGYALEQEYGDEGESHLCTVYRTEDDRSLTLDQWMGKEQTGLLLGDYRTEEVPVHGGTGVFFTETDGGSGCLLWTEGPYVLKLYSSGLTQEEMTVIAENLEW